MQTQMQREACAPAAAASAAAAAATAAAAAATGGSRCSTLLPQQTGPLRYSFSLFLYFFLFSFWPVCLLL